jgi:hypothetical protein
MKNRKKTGSFAVSPLEGANYPPKFGKIGIEAAI